jgi:hypothetical protein
VASILLLVSQLISYAVSIHLLLRLSKLEIIPDPAKEASLRLLRRKGGIVKIAS